VNRKLFIFVALFIVLGTGISWLFLSRDNTSLTAKETPGTKDYDLIVAGSDPEGVAAAVSGARNGLKTLLVDTRPELGGLMTRGWLNSIDMNYGKDKEILNKGIFEEFYKRVEGDSFDPTTAGRTFNYLVNKEKNLGVLLNVTDIKPVVENKNRVSGVKIVLPGGETREIRARRLIDATQDADLAAAAGVPFTVGFSDCGRPGEFVATTLVFRLKGVGELDWLKLRLALKRSKEPHSGANHLSAWGFLKVMKEYRPLNGRCAVRGLNIGRVREGRVLINTLQIYGVNPLDPLAREEARLLAEEEIPLIAEYIKNHIPGMSSAVLDSTAPELYIRQSRQMQGLYRLSVDDVLENRDFGDRIALGSYPVDIQATGPHFRGDIIGKPQQYAIPFRCMAPEKTENLLVVGRSASFDALAAGSARVIPVGMAAGQAAGAAAALSIEHGLSFKEMSAAPGIMAELQSRLNVQEMELRPFQASVPWADHWAYPGLRFIRHWGMASGGYTNNYRLDQEMPVESFVNGLSKIVSFTGAGAEPEKAEYPRGQKLTLETAAKVMCAYLGMDLSPSQAYRYLAQKGFWEPVVLEHVRREGQVSRGAGYMIIKRFAGWKADHGN
jgi:hypothetical protein